MTAVVRTRARGVVLGLTLALQALLVVAYFVVQDSTAWGEALCVWPSFFWALAIGPLVLLLHLLGGRGRIPAALFLLFVIATTEWRSLLRQPDPALMARFESLRQGHGGDSSGAALRLTSWNVARTPLLNRLEPVRPDICFFQESVDPRIGGAAPYWSGFHWEWGFDPSVLSRYPVRRLHTESIGAWGDPLLLSIRLPNGRSVVLANVRLLLPKIVFDTTVANSRYDGMPQTYRLQQYPHLARLLEAAMQEAGTRTLILAGDFNIPGGMASLAPLRPVARDVWPEKGIGWGATMSASWPTARIDQCWVTPDVMVVQARVGDAEGSDHRMLIVDLIVD